MRRRQAVDALGAAQAGVALRLGQRALHGKLAKRLGRRFEIVAPADAADGSRALRRTDRAAVTGMVWQPQLGAHAEGDATAGQRPAGYG